MAIVSAMMLIACYNAYLSYDYHYFLKVAQDRNLSDNISTHSIPNALLEQSAKDWATSRTIQIGLIGIRVSVDDAEVLGTRGAGVAVVLAGAGDSPGESHNRLPAPRHSRRCSFSRWTASLTSCAISSTSRPAGWGGRIRSSGRSLAAYVVLFIPLALRCRKASRFSYATEAVLREYGAKLMADLRAPLTSDEVVQPGAWR